MNKVLMIAPMASVHKRFNTANIDVLQKLGCEVHLLANFDIGEATENQNDAYFYECRKKGIYVHNMPFQRHSLSKNLSLIHPLKHLLEKERFSLVHAHTETGGILLRLCMNANTESKFLYTPHGMSFYKGSSLFSQALFRPIEKWICRKMTAVLAMNGEELTFLKKWNPQSARFVHGIGIDLRAIQKYKADSTSIRHELKIPLDAKIILSVGELNTNKNHRVILPSIAAAENVYYVICGEGVQREALLTQAKLLKIEKRLILTGYRYDILSFFYIADIYVFPSFHEGLPVSLMEAMAVGLPVVCSRIRGNIDLIEHNYGGFLCEVDDEKAYKSAIQKLIDDKDLRKQFGQMNKQKVQEFSKENVELELTQIYVSSLQSS